MKKDTPEICPQCGAGVPPGALSCPECGSDEKTGWSDDAAADRLGLPGEGFDYDEFMQEEMGTPSPVRPRGISWVSWVVAILLVFLMIWFFVL